MQLISGLAVEPGSPGVAVWAHVGGFCAGIPLYLLLRPHRTQLLQPQRTPIFATAPPTAMVGRRTFHHGSVPDSGRSRGGGSPWGSGSDPWGRS
jgi:hypothetical protein